MYIPIEINIEHATKLMEMCDLQAYYKNGKIIIIINIPLSDNIVYYSYHIIPLPMSHDKNSTSIGFVQPSYKYLAVSIDNSKYFQLEEHYRMNIIYVKN